MNEPTTEAVPEQLLRIRHPLLEQIRPTFRAALQQGQRVLGLGVLGQDHDADGRADHGGELAARDDTGGGPGVGRGGPPRGR